MQRGFARTVGAPAWVGSERSIAQNVHNGAATPLPRRKRKRTKERFGKAERPNEIGCERAVELFALRVRQQGERDGPEIGSIVDEHIDAAQRSKDHRCYRIDNRLVRYVTNITSASR